MAGQHLNDLIHRTTGMSSNDVAASKSAWEATATALGTIQTALNDGKEALVKGFGERETGTEATAVFDGAVARISGRQQEMADVALALTHASTAMKSAETAAGDAPAAPPDSPPAAPPTLGETVEDVTALKQHANEVHAYNQTVTAYGNADEDARKKVEELLKRYDEAYTALSKIEGEQAPPPPGGTDGSGPGLPRYVPPPRTTPVGTWIGDDGGPDGPDVHVPGIPGIPGDPGHGGNGPSPVPAPPPVHTLDPDLPPLGPGPGGSGSDGHGFGVGPAVLGGATAAGVFGAPGLVRGLRGLVGGRGLSGNSVGSIGSSPRTGAPGSLGRSGAGTPGSPVSRSGGRGGAAGRGGRAAGAGGAGGRGTGAVGAAGGRSRRRSEEKDGQDRDLFDDGEDWIDDEGAAPGVLD